MDTTQPWNNTVDEALRNPEDALREGKRKVDRIVEKTSDMAPSNAFVIASLASIVVSATLFLFGKKKASLFVGQWAPTFMLFGIFNKLTKNMGSD